MSLQQPADITADMAVVEAVPATKASSTMEATTIVVEDMIAVMGDAAEATGEKEDTGEDTIVTVSEVEGMGVTGVEAVVRAH